MDIAINIKEILQVVESKYGSSDTSYTIRGIEFTDVEYPHLWYPVNTKDIVIMITKNCKDDINRATFQVSHEVIHCLSPTGDSTSNYLEEGLATHFSIEFTKSKGYGNWTPDKPRYKEALKLVEDLFLLDSDIIKKIRGKEPMFSKITKDLMIETNPKIPLELAENLVRKF